VVVENGVIVSVVETNARSHAGKLSVYSSHVTGALEHVGGSMGVDGADRLRNRLPRLVDSVGIALEGGAVVLSVAVSLK
jgi:hypothetical protein